MVAYWVHIPDILVRVEASAILTPHRLKQKALNMGGVAQLVEREKCSPSMILIVDNAVEVGLLQSC